MTILLRSRVISSAVPINHISPVPLAYSNHAFIKKSQGFRHLKSKPYGDTTNHPCTEDHLDSLSTATVRSPQHPAAPWIFINHPRHGYRRILLKDFKLIPTGFRQCKSYRNRIWSTVQAFYLVFLVCVNESKFHCLWEIYLIFISPDSWKKFALLRE
jgi:hypothetical protein